MFKNDEAKMCNANVRVHLDHNLLAVCTEMHL